MHSPPFQQRTHDHVIGRSSSPSRNESAPKDDNNDENMDDSESESETRKHKEQSISRVSFPVVAVYLMQNEFLGYLGFEVRFFFVCVCLLSFKDCAYVFLFVGVFLRHCFVYVCLGTVCLFVCL